MTLDPSVSQHAQEPQPHSTDRVPSDRHWRGTRLLALGIGTGFLILVLAFLVPAAFGIASDAASLLKLMWVPVMAGAVLTACVGEAVRRWTYSHTALVIASVVVVGVSLTVPFLALGGVQAATRLMDSRLIFMNFQTRAQDQLLLTLLAGVVVILIALSIVLLKRTPVRPTRKAYRLWITVNWVAPILIAVLLLVDLMGPGSPTEQPASLLMGFLTGGPIFMVYLVFTSAPGYLLAAVLALAFLVAAWVYSGWHGFDLRRRTFTTKRRAAFVLILLSIPLSITGWMLATGRMTEGWLSSVAPLATPLTAAQIPQVPITLCLVAALLCLGAALALCRSGAVLSLLLMTGLLAVIALPSIWSAAPGL